MSNEIKKNDKPNIGRMIETLTNTGVTTKSSMHLCDLFVQFVIQEEFDDEAINDEFADGHKDDSFFLDWLQEQHGNDIAESELNVIWNQLSNAYKGTQSTKPINNPNNSNNTNNTYNHNNVYITVYDEGILLATGYTKTFVQNVPEGVIRLIASWFYRPYNPLEIYHLSVTDERIQFIRKQIEKQCESYYDPVMYTIIQIGKQNGNKPLLMYLVDSYNRFRIKRRHQFKRKYIHSFAHKFTDITASRFVNQKCPGLDTYLSEQYTENEINNFKKMCELAINKCFRHVLHGPPMFATVARINDSLVSIASYIFESYLFVHNYVINGNASNPIQIDLLIIPKEVKVLSFYGSEESETENELDEGHDNTECFSLQIGDIGKRLQHETNVVKHMVNWRTAQNVMLKSINCIIENKTHQRAVIIVDRRENMVYDKIYCYQPNAQSKCDGFQSNSDTLLNVALFANSKRCLLPKTESETTDIGISCPNPFGITLSFHCFGVDKISVYLSFNGWCTRFLIDDVFNFLPEFFTENQQMLFKEMRTKQTETVEAFAQKFVSARNKCRDASFSQFYQALRNGKPL